MWQVSYFVYGCIRMYKMKNENPGSVALYFCASISNHKLSKDVTSRVCEWWCGLCCLFWEKGSFVAQWFSRIMDDTQEWPPITQQPSSRSLSSVDLLLDVWSLCY